MDGFTRCLCLFSLSDASRKTTVFSRKQEYSNNNDAIYIFPTSILCPVWYEMTTLTTVITGSPPAQYCAKASSFSPELCSFWTCFPLECLWLEPTHGTRLCAFAKIPELWIGRHPRLWPDSSADGCKTCKSSTVGTAR